MSRLLLVVFCGFALALGGCGNDFGLGLAPDPGGDDDDVDDDDAHPGGPGVPIDPPGPPGPWDHLDPGSLPDVHLAVAHHGADCDEDGIDPHGAWESDMVMVCPVTYAVIDLEGQVVSEFSVPVAEGPWAFVQHLELRAAGPGRFVALVENWSDAGAVGQDDATGGLWVSPFLQVWMADAVDGTMRLLVEMQDLGRTALVHTNGRQVRLTEGMGTALFGVWPDASETKLVVWEGNPSCDSGVGSLRAVELGASPALDWVWPRNDLLPEDLQQGCTYAPWNMDEGVDEDGSPSFLLGVTEYPESPGDSPDPRRLVAWSPTEGPMWDVVVPDLVRPFRAEYSALGGGGALWISAPLHAEGRKWHVVGPSGSFEGGVPDDLFDVQPGPLLDPQGPTFLMVGRLELDSRHSIRLVHRDQVAWSIDHLRFGLDARRLFFSDVVLLPPVEDSPGP